MEEIHIEGEVHSCEIKLRENPRRRKEVVRIGCGAGFSGDRPKAAVRLVERVKELDYLVLECLAERTLADRYQIMIDGGVGYDPRVSDWISLLLPLTVEKEICIITNMGAVDPRGAQREVLQIAKSMGFDITVALAYETDPSESGLPSQRKQSTTVKGVVSTYLGAAPIVECLEKYNPHIVITSRVADAALFLAPMVYELGWNWNDFQLLAQGCLAGHLLECGCQLTGGYFMHPGDKSRSLTFQQLLDLSLPFAEVSFEGEVCVAKAEGSGGVLNYATCAEQLLYEVGDPGAYVTPDVSLDLLNVKFLQLSEDKVLCSGAKSSNAVRPDKLLQLTPKYCGWKGWGEISYGGYGCITRAEAAKFLVLSWMREAYPGTEDCVASYIIGLDSLKMSGIEDDSLFSRNIMDLRLRMDGLFNLKKHAVNFVNEFMALYTNGPAGGGGISTGLKKEIMLQKELVTREAVFWKTEAKLTKVKNTTDGDGDATSRPRTKVNSVTIDGPSSSPEFKSFKGREYMDGSLKAKDQQSLVPSCMRIPLYEVAHSRAGDKGNDLNFSIIPHCPEDISRLKKVITADWVIQVLSPLVVSSSFPGTSTIEERDNLTRGSVSVEIYEVKGIHSLNVVVRNILDGGVNCSRRIDRHGKTISDLILWQKVVLPPLSLSSEN